MTPAEEPPLHVLVIEDPGAALLFTCTALEGAGHTVDGASSAAEARVLLGRHRPDLVLLDLMLAGVDGFELTRELKADPRTTRIPVLMLTGQPMPLYERLAHAAGCDGFLVKAGSAAVLSAQVRDFMEARSHPGGGAAAEPPQGPEAPAASPGAAASRPDWLEPV